MRKNLGVKAFLMPMPVLIVASYDENGVADAMNAAYGSLATSKTVSLFIGKSRKTIKNILKSKAFTVALADKKNMVDADYVGIVSGNKVLNKLDNTDFKIEKSSLVNAPIITNLPLVLECKLEDYDEEKGHLLGEIVNVSVDEEYLDENGKIDLEKMQLIAFNPAGLSYNIIGEKVGDAFSCGKEKINK